MRQKVVGLRRHIVGDRRHHRRRRHKHDAIVRNIEGRELFRGWTLDLSATGAKFRGFPSPGALFECQDVTIEFLLVPKDAAQVAQRVPLAGHICRIEEKEDDFLLAVTFSKSLEE